MTKFMEKIPVVSYFANVMSTSTFRQSSLTFTATFINGLLGMIFYIFLARKFGPFNFGLFSLSITVLALVADIGNFGINTGIVNFVSKYFNTDYSKSLKFMKLGLYSKVTMALIVLLGGYFFAPFLSNKVFAKPELLIPFRLISIGVGTTWMFSFTTSYYQASQKFVSWGAVQIFTNLIRLVSVLYLAQVAKLTLYSAIICYISAPLIGFLVSFINISMDFLKEKLESSIRGEFFNYNKWVAIFSGIAAFSSRTDTFVLGRLVTPTGIGIYSAANQLVQVVPQLIGAIGTVVAPKFSSFSSQKVMLEYFKKLQVMVGGIAIFILICTPLVRIIINSFFGEAYRNSFAIFMILLLAMLIFLISVPVHNAIIYYYSYPKLFTYLSILNFAVVATASIYLTLNFGYKATACAILLGNSVNFIIPLVWFLRKVQSQNRLESKN
jgi:O-antigen/teichoic acid export membrane protein